VNFIILEKWLLLAVCAICDEQKGGLGSSRRLSSEFFCFSKNPREYLTGRVINPLFISAKE